MLHSLFFQIAESPLADTQLAESPLAESPLAESPLAESPLAESPLAESPLAESPLAESPLAESSLAESPLAESPLAESQLAVSLTEPKWVKACEKGYDNLISRYSLFSSRSHCPNCYTNQRFFEGKCEGESESECEGERYKLPVLRKKSARLATPYFFQSASFRLLCFRLFCISRLVRTSLFLSIICSKLLNSIRPNEPLSRLVSVVSVSCCDGCRIVHTMCSRHLPFCALVYIHLFYFPHPTCFTFLSRVSVDKS